MKRGILNSIFSILTVGITVLGCTRSGLAAEQTPPATAGDPASQAKPKVQFASLIHDFGKITSGEQVKCEFSFTNTGNGVLEMTDVRPGCGCTTAGQWTRRVEPGKTGSIPLQFNSGNFSGQITKTATVTCNDPSQPTVTLQLKAEISKSIEVSSQYAILNLTTEAPSNATTVRIINHLEKPLTISELESKTPAFAAELTTVRPGKEYEVLIKTMPPFPTGPMNGQITMKTSASNMPVINITAWANVQHTITVTPAQLMLPSGPLSANLTHTVWIRNTGAKPVTLSEPTVNAKDIAVKITAIQPGNYFSLSVNFPKGYQVSQGEKVELSVKTDHPKYPVIKVPVSQPPAAPLPVKAGSVAPPRPPTGKTAPN